MKRRDLLPNVINVELDMTTVYSKQGTHMTSHGWISLTSWFLTALVSPFLDNDHQELGSGNSHHY